MYSLIIVDDESEIRNGLAELVDWGSLGFKLEASFEDGRDAVEYLRQSKADVVLTDIRMAEMSGLEVAAFVNRELSGTITVILSGYKEFEYAKQAIDYNVRHYLLKPTKVAELKQIFGSIREELDQRQRETEAIKVERARYQELVALLHEEFFTDLVMGALRNPEEIKKRINRIDLEAGICANPCWMMDMSIKEYEKYQTHSWKYGRMGMETALKNLLTGAAGNIKLFPVLSGGSEFKLVAISLKVEDEEALQASLHAYLEYAINSVRSILGIEISVISGQSFENLFALAGSNQQIEANAAPQSVENGSDRVPSIESARLVDRIKMIVSNICEGNTGQVRSLLESLMDGIENLPVKYNQHLIVDLFALLFNKLAYLGMDIHDKALRVYDYQSILQMDGKEEIRNYSIKALEDITRHLSRQGRNSSIHQLVEKAEDYILRHYHEDISLESVADRVFLNPVYLSRMFKQIKGENFSDYLTDVRMKKAMELLEKGNGKINEVGIKVGYNSTRYFNMVFKKYTGSTPKEYCRKVMNEE